MKRRPASLYDREEVIDLMKRRLNGSIRSLRELKESIEELTGEQVALTTLWQQIHKLKEQLMEQKPGFLRSGKVRELKNDGKGTNIKEEDCDDSGTNAAAPIENSEDVKVPLRRSSRTSKRKSFSPTPSPTFEMKKPVTESKGSNVRHVEETVEDPLAKAKSKVWLFCEKFEEGGESKAKCRICGMVMVRKLGSTRAMLRHLRKMHDNLIDGIIRPVTKRVTKIAGKPRDNNGFDIDDDSAWVEEVNEDDFNDYGEQQFRTAEQCMGKEKVIAYDTYADGDDGPTYADEVFLRQDGSYADGDDFVDVVYVQDENSFEEMMPKSNEGNSFTSNEVGSLDARDEEVATPSSLQRTVSDSELAQPSHHNDNFFLCRGNGNLRTACSRSLENLTLLVEDERRRQNNVEDVDEARFGRLVAASVQAFLPEQRAHVRSVILQCIAELRRSAIAVAAAMPETIEEADEMDDLLQVSDP